MKANGAARGGHSRRPGSLPRSVAPHLLRVIFDRWSRSAEASGDSDEALRLARRALETIRV